jgi:hypothetical protein
MSLAALSERAYVPHLFREITPTPWLAARRLNAPCLNSNQWYTVLVNPARFLALVTRSGLFWFLLICPA